jgi:hypothetical protein
MSASTEKTDLKPDMKWLDGDTIDKQQRFSEGFDPKETAAQDAKEVVWKYAEKIKQAISS